MNNIDKSISTHIKVLQYIHNTKDDPETTAFNAYQMQKEYIDEFLNERYNERNIAVKINDNQLKEIEQNVFNTIKSALK